MAPLGLLVGELEVGGPGGTVPAEPRLYQSRWASFSTQQLLQKAS